MRVALLVVFVAVGLGAARLAAGPAGPGGAPGSDVVERVVDGDTVHLRDAGRARLIGVDTPETFGRAECFGAEASRALRRMLPRGARVTVRRDAEPADRHGRALVYVWTGDRFVNGTLVERGLAVPLTIPPNVAHAETLVRLARRARADGRGLWSAAACQGDPDVLR